MATGGDPTTYGFAPPNEAVNGPIDLSPTNGLPLNPVQPPEWANQGAAPGYYYDNTGRHPTTDAKYGAVAAPTGAMYGGVGAMSSALPRSYGQWNPSGAPAPAARAIPPTPAATSGPKYGSFVPPTQTTTKVNKGAAGPASASEADINAWVQAQIDSGAIKFGDLNIPNG